MNIILSSDHAGYALKQYILNYLQQKGHECMDLGPFSEERVDYPDFAHALARQVLQNPSSLGIILCGSGNGVNITVNKHQGIRSALCWNSEIASLARAHNNANVMALPARFIHEAEALACVDAFLSTSFEGGRHAERVLKIEPLKA